MKKNIVIKTFLYFIILISISSNFAFSQTLKLGYIEFPPVFSTNQEGRPQGILIDLASQVIPKAGYKWEAYSYPVKRMANYMAKGKLDLWIGLKTIPIFNDTTIKGSTKVLTITLKAYKTKNLPDITKKEDLLGKSIIILRGFSYGGWINYITDPANNIDYIETHDHKAAFRMLKAGRADYLLNYKYPAIKALKIVDIPDLKDNTISSFGAYFVLSKKTPNASMIIKKLELAYEDLKKSGNL